MSASQRSKSISVRSRHRQGLLCAGQRFSHALTWMGEPTEGIRALVKGDAVVLVFRSRWWGGSYGQFITQRVLITWTASAFGGQCPWFRCDVAPSLRNIRRARKIRMRLGAGFSFVEPFPEKPPRMHWPTSAGEPPPIDTLFHAYVKLLREKWQ
jgi:hypothetical protein